MGRVKVLWEDASNKGDVPAFGPHRLLVACVVDEIGGDRHEVQRAKLIGIPKKGVGAIERACRNDLDDLSNSGEHVIAVVDADRCDVDQLRLRLGNGRLTVLPLIKNIETLLHAVAECFPSVAEKARAATMKDPNSRDAVLNELASLSGSAERKCVRAKSPSFDGIVRTAVEKIKAGPSRGKRSAPETARKPIRK